MSSIELKKPTTVQLKGTSILIISTKPETISLQGSTQNSIEIIKSPSLIIPKQWVTEVQDLTFQLQNNNTIKDEFKEKIKSLKINEINLELKLCTHELRKFDLVRAYI